MKTDPSIVISIDKQFYSEDDEVKIHVWLNRDFYSAPILIMLKPYGAQNRLYPKCIFQVCVYGLKQ